MEIASSNGIPFFVGVGGLFVQDPLSLGAIQHILIRANLGFQGLPDTA
jgi:hypothetical protein